MQKAIEAALAQLNRYPDDSGFYLRQALAKKHGVAAEQIVLGNGSNELIELIVHSFVKPGDEAVVPHPSFVLYPMIVQAAGAIRVMVMLKDYRLDLEAMARAITPTTKLVFIANPNNPTATIVTADEVERFMAQSAGAHHRGLRRGLHRVRPRARTFPTRSATSSRDARWWCCGPSPRPPAWPACASATASPTPTPSPS